MFFLFFFKQKTAYELPLCDWSSDVCSSDLSSRSAAARRGARAPPFRPGCRRTTAPPAWRSPPRATRPSGWKARTLRPCQGRPPRRGRSTRRRSPTAAAGWRCPGAVAAPARRAGTSARGARPPDQPERGDDQEHEQRDHRPRRYPYRRAEPREQRVAREAARRDGGGVFARRTTGREGQCLEGEERQRRNSRSGQVLTPCPPLRVAERGDDSKRRCASRPISGANNRWSATAASTVPAVPTSVVVQTPSRGPYQMMAGSWGTTARAMLDRNAYAKSSAVGVAGRCMARCFT